MRTDDVPYVVSPIAWAGVESHKNDENTYAEPAA
jgi:hypothetical protein